MTAASLPRPAFDMLYGLHFPLAEHFQYIVARQLVRELRRLDAAVAASLHGGDFGPLRQAAADVAANGG